MAAKLLIVLLVVLVSSVLCAWGLRFHDSKGRTGACPCSDTANCEPVMAGPRKEVLGFVTHMDNWKKYNWTYITTLAMFTNLTSDLMCYAHSKGVRVVLSGNYPISALADVTRRRAWIATQLDKVTQMHADGYNIDIEDPTREGTDDSRQLTEFVGEFYEVFKKANKHYQVTFDVAWSPNCTDGRCYDALGLSKVTDFLVVMGYDERSQIDGPCVAGANSAAYITSDGLQAYLDLGIGGDHLVMGLPWYGYNYPCLQLTGDVCQIKAVPFRGAYCSDAAGSEVNYRSIVKLLANSTGMKWDMKTFSPYFNIKINGTDHQIWYDIPYSISSKSLLGRIMGVHGLAFWTFDSLDYTATPSQSVPPQTTAMWRALEWFFEDF